MTIFSPGIFVGRLEGILREVFRVISDGILSKILELPKKSVNYYKKTWKKNTMKFRRKRSFNITNR